MSVSVPDSTMGAIDTETKRLGMSRSHFVAEAIDFFIGSGRNLKTEINKLNDELMKKTEEADSLSKKVLQLEQRIPTIESQSRMKDYDINRLREELEKKTSENKTLSEKVLQLEEQIPTIEKRLAETKNELNSKSGEVFQKDKKIHTLENQITERDKDFNSKISELGVLTTQIAEIKDQLNEAEKLKEKLGSALQAKEEEVAFLRGHIAQLTQSISQLSLKPGEEEIKRKGWWQFWRR